jgi:hypothetical protein
MAAQSGRSGTSSEVRFPAASHVTIRAAHGRRIVVRLFPEAARLARDVSRAAAEVGDAATEEALRAALEQRLRAWYPRLTIHERTELAALDLEEPVWYVMRDGRVHLPEPRIDRIHDALAVARDVTSEAAETIARAQEIVAAAAGAVGRRSSRAADRQRGDHLPDD